MLSGNIPIAVTAGPQADHIHLLSGHLVCQVMQEKSGFQLLHEFIRRADGFL